jgi:type I restriction enzyme S subunit
MRAANVTWAGISLHDVKEMDFSASEAEVYELRHWDILLSEASGSVGEVGKPAIWRSEVEGACFQNTLIRVRCNELNIANFVYWHFVHDVRTRKFSAASKGTGIHHLGAKTMERWRMVIPPLAEQRRIVAEIEKQFTRLDAAVANLERVKANLKRARASVLKAAVEGRLVPTEAALAKAAGRSYESAPVLLERILVERERKHRETNGKKKYAPPGAPNTDDLPELPEGWVWSTIDQCSMLVRNGYSKKPDDDGDVSILRISAVRPGFVDRSETRKLRGEHSDFIDYTVLPGDLLFTRYNGTRSLVGVCGLVRAGEPLVYPDKLIRVVMVPAVSAPFVEKVVNAGASRAFVEGKIRTTAGQSGVSGDDVRHIPVPLPPLAEQHRIVAEVERRLSVIDTLEQVADRNLTRCNRLRQSILKRAFEGKLVPQDPNDEPAEELLARIKTKTA